MKKDDRLIQDFLVCDRQLAIVEKYETFLNYVYPIAQRMDRRHSLLRDAFLAAAIDQVRLFIEAGKSRNISKLYAADANLGLLRFHLRFMVSVHAGFTPNNHRVASVHLAEVGGMVNAWIAKVQEAQKKG
jgi:hypothetical protein